MMRSMQSAVTGLRAQQTAMDVIGNNIANVNTVGFKASVTNFSDLFYQTLTNASATVNPSQVGYGAQVSNVSKNMSTVGASTTDSPYDLYIDGEGFFSVATSSTATSPDYYTRVGHFSFNQGYLVDGSGNYVLSSGNTAIDLDGTVTAGVCSVQLKPTDGSSNIDIDDVATANDPKGTYSALTNISINSDGSISATVDNKTGTLVDGSGNTIKIGLATFINSSGLSQVGQNYYAATTASGAPTYTTAGNNNSTVIRTGELEMSNVDLAKEFTNMITTERGYQANSRVITVSDTMLEELINLKRS